MKDPKDPSEENEIKQTDLRDLDKPYHQLALDMIRKSIHKTIVIPTTVLNRKDYQIYFDPESKFDFSFRAGTPFAVILNVHPYDAPNVLHLASIAFSRSAVIKQMRIAKQVVRQKDAAVWYGVDIVTSTDYNLAENKRLLKELNRSRFEANIIDTIVILEVKDHLTGRSIKATVRRGDVFTTEQKLIQILREE